jgi:hypothetical protein
VAILVQRYRFLTRSTKLTTPLAIACLTLVPTECRPQIDRGMIGSS